MNANELSASQIAQQVFHISQLKPVQAEIIEQVMAGRDVLAVLPTGAGKSLCYQIPAILLGGLTIVVSPLISLIQDQVDKLHNLGLSATTIHSHLPLSIQLSRTRQILQNEFTFCYVSPERLGSPAFRPILQHCHIHLIAIDEAHCVSLWGGDFRPSYRRVGQVILSLPTRPRLLAVTATADHQIVQDVIRYCQLRQSVLTTLPAHRPNLQIQIRRCHRRTTRNILILQWVMAHALERGIIYCATRAETQLWQSYLNQLSPRYGITAGLYHGRLTAQQRHHSVNLFQNRVINCMVATSAFGMGIDLPDIRYILHAQMPGSLEQYVQEIGRAGRDGHPSTVVCLAHVDDREIYQQFAHHAIQRRRAMAQLHAMEQLVSSKQCRQQHITNYFSVQKHSSFRCGICDCCQKKVASLEHWLLPSNQAELKLRTKVWQSYCHKHQIRLSSEQLLWLAIVQPSARTEFQIVPGVSAQLAARLANVSLEV